LHVPICRIDPNFQLLHKNTTKHFRIPFTLIDWGKKHGTTAVYAMYHKMFVIYWSCVHFNVPGHVTQGVKYSWLADQYPGHTKVIVVINVTFNYSTCWHYVCKNIILDFMKANLNSLMIKISSFFCDTFNFCITVYSISRNTEKTNKLSTVLVIKNISHHLQHLHVWSATFLRWAACSTRSYRGGSRNLKVRTHAPM
jgi:hypothetical protein